MKKIIIGLIILCLLLISGCAKDISFEELRKCDVDVDCVVVEGRKCCECSFIITQV